MNIVRILFFKSQNYFFLVESSIDKTNIETMNSLKEAAMSISNTNKKYDEKLEYNVPTTSNLRASSSKDDEEVQNYLGFLKVGLNQFINVLFTLVCFYRSC